MGDGVALAEGVARGGAELAGFDQRDRPQCPTRAKKRLAAASNDATARSLLGRDRLVVAA